MRVKVIKPHPYGGSTRAIGEIYELEDKYVDIMVAIGNVERVAGYETLDTKPDGTKKYRRRDMKAEQ